MSYLNIITNSGITPGSVADLGTGSVAGLGTGTSSSKNMSKITIYGFTVLILYSLTKILNFYGIGVEVYGPYLMFYVFLIVWANIFYSEHAKL